MAFLQRDLCEAGVVAGEFLDAECGAVAGIPENNRLEFQPFVNRQHRHVVIDGAFEGLRGDELGYVTVRFVFAAVDAEACDADAVF